MQAANLFSLSIIVSFQGSVVILHGTPKLVYFIARSSPPHMGRQSYTPIRYLAALEAQLLIYPIGQEVHLFIFVAEEGMQMDTLFNFCVGRMFQADGHDRKPNLNANTLHEVKEPWRRKTYLCEESMETNSKTTRSAKRKDSKLHRKTQ